jgi:hypothetical protein
MAGTKLKDSFLLCVASALLQQVVLYEFKHSTLTVPSFQEDLGFCSAEQLEADKSMFKI